MDITKEQIDDLNASLIIKVGPQDYEKQVETALKSHRKNVKIPGFRPGKVPMGMVQKMYGKSVLLEELNKLLSAKLFEYIEHEQLDILGNPLPSEGSNIDIDKQTEFELSYDIGLVPQFEVNIPGKEKFNYYKIKVNDELIDKYVKDICRQYGKVAAAESSKEDDMLYGAFSELDSNGEVLEGGIHNHSTIAIEYVDDAVKKKLLGLKVDDIITIDPNKVSRGPADLAAMLGIKSSEAGEVSKNFQFKVINIHRMDPSEVNQDLFDKVFGPGNVTSEEDFRAKVAEELERMLASDSDGKLRRDITETLIDKYAPDLPDSFLKRWLLKSNEEELTEEQIESEYEDYAKGLKWQLIENKISKEHDVKVSSEEMVERATILLQQQLAKYGQTNVDPSQLTSAANNLLSKEEEARKVAQQLMEEKLLSFFKDTYKLADKEVSFDEFVKLATGKPAKSRLMDNLSNFINKF